jgi:lipopolysaccharide export system protein LptA
VCLAAALALSAVGGPMDAQGANEKAAPAPTGSQAAGSESSGGPFAFGSLGKSKEPITVISDKLDYDYKANIVVYRGSVQVTQGDVKMVSDELTITLENDNKNDNPNDKPAAKPQGETTASDPPAAAAPPATDQGKVKEIVAVGNVRIDQGTRWAVGGRAIYEQQQRTLVLIENPVLHDGPNVVVGERVTVYLDENRSVVEGGQKRVKAVFHPNEKNNTPPAPAKPKAGATATPTAARGTQ